jgi:hypothetical protein
MIFVVENGSGGLASKRRILPRKWDGVSDRWGVSGHATGRRQCSEARRAGLRSGALVEPRDEAIHIHRRGRRHMLEMDFLKTSVSSTP